MLEENLIAVPIYQHAANAILNLEQMTIFKPNDLSSESISALIKNMPENMKKIYEDDNSRILVIINMANIIDVINVLYKAGYNTGFEEGSKQYVLRAC